MTDRDRRLLVLDGPIDGQWRELSRGDRLTEPVTRALFSHDAGLLLAAGRATAWLWETGTWTCRGAFPLVPPGGAGPGAPQARGGIMGAYFSRDGAARSRRRRHGERPDAARRRGPVRDASSRARRRAHGARWAGDERRDQPR